MSTDINKVLLTKEGWTVGNDGRLFKSVYKKRYRIIANSSQYRVQLQNRFLFINW